MDMEKYLDQARNANTKLSNLVQDIDDKIWEVENGKTVFNEETILDYLKFVKHSLDTDREVLMDAFIKYMFKKGDKC